MRPKLPEPTAVLSAAVFGTKADGAVGSAVAVHATSRRRLSLGPLGIRRRL